MSLPTNNAQEPKPKGFWRRNWPALAFFIAQFTATLLSVKLDGFLRGYFFILHAGCGGIVVERGYARDLNSAAVELDYQGFRPFGLPEFINSPRGFNFVFPPVISLTGILAWIAFREWRRKKMADPFPLKSAPPTKA